ncbi:MAG: UDP-N-acetylglucosamine--N-acetylmuramyl-(pentapeptide) pyrophosphoryl-undecaprenol N-acetylglucosamine transferase [Clostridia bacterium]|nr:UDP-N-acetylglucosamine--N-acetylmuramyl-(pentapeptide) pyrophosphoryl-undecaprenol N-acetylglucosamine transferase [Clostridia bacterium]
MYKIVFTGGGSAGHVIPNVALIDELIKTGEADIAYFGSDGIEKKLVASKKIPYFELAPPKLKRSLSAFTDNLKIPFIFSKAVKKAEEGLRAFSPDLVFSKGGYVALPVVFAAAKLGVPCIAHESDYSIGLANRLSAKKCASVLTSFPETARKIRNGKFSGPPIRAELFAHSRSAAKRELCEGTSRKVILVFGGGSGSETLNEAVRKAAKRLTERYFILQVCGKGKTIDCRLKNYKQVEFITDMGAAYACADLVVSRAGAGTIFELLALKKPALLVPLEGQTRGDQIENAAYFEKQGVCRILKQGELKHLAEEIDAAILDEQLKRQLALFSYPLGNENLLHEIRELVKKQ